MAGTSIVASDSPAGAPNVARVAALATTNATLVKAGPGVLYGFYLSAPAAAAKSAYVKIYDKVTAPVVGTDTPLFTIPVISTTTLPGIVELSLDYGIPLKLGLSYAITAVLADSDTTAVGAGDVHGFLLWK